MEYRAVGRTGLVVSVLGLGTMTWGRDTDDLDATDQLADFLEAGGTLIDTAASYGDGAAEEQLGKLIGTVAERSDLIIATKSGVGTRGGQAVVDASRGNLLASLDASLERLGTSWIDLWLVQAPDPHTPLAETLSALTMAVRSGRARYVGLSNHPAWTTAAAAAELRREGIELAGVEMEYSLLQRGIEREVIPAAAGMGFGVLAWSPLGRGVLTGKYRHSIPADSRAASAHLRGFVEPYLNSSAGAIVEAVATAADGLGVSPLAVALAWVRRAPQVASAIVGGRTAGQLRASLGAVDLELPEAIAEALSEVSAPHPAYPERF
ncbi:MAG: aldo/keto reductase [Bifidobacteriaceae bacterium]|jgi:aryl-alcohol dehydrogenase-like predicted oxidoreductase|nr:aldo/keto reductase [Bifidobacteriaceae bacterium]